jgi:hypothetical protein
MNRTYTQTASQCQSLPLGHLNQNQIFPGIEDYDKANYGLTLGIIVCRENLGFVAVHLRKYRNTAMSH